jgi:hypothetical protein
LETLQKKILVRRSFAEYTASRHDDLMVGASRLVFESDPEEPGAH